jgi:arylsulfatase A-like enzyme
MLPKMLAPLLRRARWTPPGLGFALLGVSLFGAACSEPEPFWTSIDANAVTLQVRPDAAFADAGAEFKRFQTLNPTDWSAGPLPGIRMAQLAVPGTAQSDDPNVPHQLETIADAATVTFVPVPYTPALLAETAFAPGMFTVAGDYLFLFDPQGELTQSPLRYTGTYPAWSGGTFDLGGVTSNGWLLTPNQALVIDLPEAHGPATLYFNAMAYGSSDVAGPSIYRMQLDGEELVRELIMPEVYGKVSAKRVPLDLDGAHQLTVSIVSGQAFLAFANPRLMTQAWIDQAQQEPARPNVLLFVADTFRADNMAMNGGDPEWTPALNQWAQTGLGFTQARATAPWTLPSHSSIFSSLYPHQHGAISTVNRLPEEVTTLTEQMRAAGYRTVAVTDGIYLTPRYGLAQGFETFVQFDPSKEFALTTLKAVQELLKQDDGRPVFMYVQTYFTHNPYSVLPATIAAKPEWFDPSLPLETWDWSALDARFAEQHSHATETGASHDDEEATLDQIEAMYRGGAYELDAWFARVLAEFKEASRSEPIVVFTSDHGDAFGEHTNLYHGESIYDEEVRVPLVLTGPGLQSAVRDEIVSLVDLAPTLAQLTDVASGRDWVGRSLVAPNGKPTRVGSFGSEPRDPEAQKPYALFEQSRKLIGTTEARKYHEPLVEAYDLRADPNETTPVDPALWAEAMIEQSRATLDVWLTPLFPNAGMQLTKAERAMLAQMGYLDATD